MSKLQKGDKIV